MKDEIKVQTIFGEIFWNPKKERLMDAILKTYRLVAEGYQIKRLQIKNNK